MADSGENIASQTNRLSVRRDSIYDDKPNGNLFFQVGGSNEEEELEELAELLRGRDYLATYIVSESAGKFREVTVTLGLSGIKVSEPNNKVINEQSNRKKRTREFQIEQILQYSYNRAQSRFNFSYLEADGALTNYRFMSKDTLGNAIALMVKIKNNDISQELLDRAAAAPHTRRLSIVSGSAKELVSQELAINSSNKDISEQHTLKDSHRQASSESLGAMSTMSKASLAKYYMENKYKKLTEHEIEQEKQRKLEAGHSDAPPIVVHGGDDDAEHDLPDNNSVFTVETQDDRAFTESFDDGTDHLEHEKDDHQGKKKKDKSGTKTVRGWSLFGTQRGSSKAPNRKSALELQSIDENGLKAEGGEKLGVPEVGTINKRFGSMNMLDKRRKSVQEIFGGQVPADSSERTLAQSVTVLSEASTSASSVDTANISLSKELPPVDKKYDVYGREILIKNLKGGKYDITAGTAEALVESLAEEAPPDTIYIEVFLLTFRHFMTPLQLITLLRKRFRFESSNQQAAAIIRVRTVSVLKKWAERHYYDFRFPEVIEAFNEFLADINRTECAKYGGQIKSILDAEVERSKSFAQPSKPEIPTDVQKVIDSVDFVTYWTPKKIAQELTLTDLRLFRQIKPDEFCIFLWGDKKDTRIANFNAYVDRFNRIGFWVGTLLCSQKEIKRRVDAIEKIIQVMKYLYKYQNFSTLMALISGLNTTAVSRLKKTWEIVNKGKYATVYKDIEAKMSYRSNFKAYREIEAMAKAPFIPFFGLYVKDLTFMNDGNQKHLVMSTKPASTDDANEQAPPMAPVINFEKCRTINDKIHAIRVFQQSSYKFEEEKDDNFFSNFVSTQGTEAELSIYFGHPFGPPAIDDEKKLIEMSRECEPSDKAQSSNYVTVSTATGKDIKPRDGILAAQPSTEHDKSSARPSSITAK